jgi:hypothetical protein
VSDSRIIRGDDGRCLGYGFVTIRTQDDANKAVQEMDGNRLQGRPLRVSLSRTPRLSAPPAAHGNRPADPPPSTDVNVVARQVLPPPPLPPRILPCSCDTARVSPPGIHAGAPSHRTAVQGAGRAGAGSWRGRVRVGGWGELRRLGRWPPQRQQ